MRVVAIASQKGGSGKTTLVVHLAVAAEQAGERVAVIDADPQGSAVAWAAARETETPPVVALTGADVARGVATARADGYSLVLIDTPPHTSASAAHALRQADLVLVPVRPSVLDLAAVPAALALVRAAGAAPLFVLSAAPVRARETDEVCSALEARGQLAETIIHDRAAFRRALAFGAAVQEFEPRGRAAREIATLWREIDRLTAERGTP